MRASEAFERTWNRAARPVLDGLWSAVVARAADADDTAAAADDSLVLPLYADAHLALLRDAEGTARQVWLRHPDERWRAAGRRVAQDAAREQARRLFGAGAATGGAGSSRPYQLVRRALARGEGEGGRSEGDQRITLLCRALVEQLDFRIAGALAAAAEAEAAKPQPAAEARRPAGPRTRREREREEAEAAEGGMWRAAFQMQHEKEERPTREPRRELLLALHAARRNEAAAVAAVASAAGGGSPPLVELEGAELVATAAAVPGLAPYLILPAAAESEEEKGSDDPARARQDQRALLALPLPAVRRCLLLLPPGDDSPARQALRRLAYERGLSPAVRLAAAALPEVWRWRAEAARCVARLVEVEGREQERGRERAAAPCPPPLPDAPRRLCPDPEAALGLLFEVLEAARPAADAEAASAIGAAAWDVERLLRRQKEEAEEEEGEEEGGATADALARALAPHLRLGGVLRGLARASAELLGVEIAELPPRHPDRPPDLPDHCPAFAVAATATATTTGAAAAGVVALDPCSHAEGGGYGTRVVRLRYPATDAPAGPDALVPSPAHALVAIGLALDAAGGGGGGRGADDGGGGPLPVDDPASFSPTAAGLQPSLSLQDVEDEVLPPSALWELAHEWGHALHLLLSNAAAAADERQEGDDAPPSSFAGTPLAGAGTHHLAGRFLPSDALEVLSQIFERLMLEPAFLSRVCSAADSGAPLPAGDAQRLARRLRRDYASALPVQDKALAAVAEQLCVLDAFSGGDDGGGAADAWASARASASSLSAAAAAVGGAEGEEDGDHAPPPPYVATLRQAAMLPVVARHRGTYYSYSLGWAAASALGDEALAPLVRALFSGPEAALAAEDVAALRARARAAMSAHAGLSPDELARALGLPPALWAPRHPQGGAP